MKNEYLFTEKKLYNLFTKKTLIYFRPVTMAL